MSPRRVNRKIAWALGGGGRCRVACDTQNMRGAPQSRDGQDHGHPRTARGHHGCPVANRGGGFRWVRQLVGPVAPGL